MQQQPSASAPLTSSLGRNEQSGILIVIEEIVIPCRRKKNFDGFSEYNLFINMLCWLLEIKVLVLMATQLSCWIYFLLLD